MLFLNLMLLSICLNNFQSCIYDFTEISIDYFEVPWHFLSAPFFYTFLIYYLDIHEKSIKILKVIIPLFFIFIISQLTFVLFYKDTGNADEINYIFEKYRSIEESISFLSSLSIFSYSFYIVYKKEKLFPKILMFDNLKWLYTFFKLLTFIYLFWVLALIVKFSLNFTNFISSYYPLRIFTTIVIYLLGYQGLRHLRILKERKQIRENIQIVNDELIEESDVIENEKNIVEVEVDNNKTEEQFKEIDSYVKSHKKFLHPKYTLQNLANDIGIGVSTLSLIINNNAHKTFIDYINEMRIEQSKKLLVDDKYTNYTIVSIGLESGFNSKSTFYNVFKKHVGCTPLAYKNSKKN